MKGNRTILGGGLAALAALSLLSGCGRSAEPDSAAPETVSGKHVVTMRVETVPDEIAAPGNVAAAVTAQVAARTMGTALEVAVREGDRVRQGQLLLLLDERELTARRNAARAAVAETSAGREEAARGVAVAQAQADVAARTHERFVFLRDQKSVSAQEFDEVEAKFRAAQASLEQARARQKQAEAAQGRAESEARAAETVAGYARVVAPFSGVVVSRMVEKGSLVTPGTPLFVVEDVSRYRLEVSVPASLPGLARGASARVALDALPGKEFQGKVVELEAGADPASHTVQAKVELPADPAIRSGLFGRAWFRRGERKALLVPRSAVVERGQLRGVFVVDAGGIAQWRLVTLGAVLGDRMEVLSGIGEGERIVADPGVTPLDGKRIAAGSSAGEVGR